MSLASDIDAQQLEQAMSRLQLMYAKPAHPYYIYAPDYRDTSSGIATLHYLCHLLNLNGREAYICGATVVNPDLKTPLLDQKTSSRHLAAGKVPIAVYPEVVSGDPLQCPVIARFLLNFEGFLTGKSMQAGPDDLLFYSGQMLATKRGHVDADLLYLPIIDVSLFRADETAGQRNGKYLYQNRYPLEHIDYSVFPADIRLLSMAQPLTLTQLAEVLKSAEVLYTYEWSMTCVMALLCGCPVIFVPGHGIDQAFLDTCFVGSDGFAMLDNPQALFTARAGLKDALWRYVRVTLPFWQQLEVFINKTQAAAVRKSMSPSQEVTNWLQARYPNPHQHRLMSQRLSTNCAPRIGILVTRSDNNDERLACTLKSLGRECCLYDRLGIIVLGGGSCAADVQDDRLRYVPCNAQQQVEILNDITRNSEFDWVVIVEEGVEFTPAGLMVIALELIDAPADCLAVYADEAMRNESGRVGMLMRPDLNLDLLLSFPASLCRHWLLRREALLEHGGFDATCGEAFELEYQLRLIERQGLACVGHVSEPLLVVDMLNLRDCPSERWVIERHLHARGYEHAQVPANSSGNYQLHYGHLQQPWVSVLVVLEGCLAQMQRCIESLFEHTDYPNYEVLLLSGSDELDVCQWLAGIERLGGEQIRVLRFDAQHSRAAICNQAAREARGDLLFWQTSSACMVAKGWLQQLLNHGQRPEVGAVGGKLLTTQGKVRHAGLVLGLNGSVGGAFEGNSLHDAGYQQRLQVDQNFSALSAECLLLRRELFFDAGGFDEDPLLERWIDVDLCLRLQQAGYLNVWTPHVQLLTDTPPAPKAETAQEDALYTRWLPELARDPAYNRNLSLQQIGGFTLADSQLSWSPLRSWRPLPLVLAHPVRTQGCGQNRVIDPFKAMKAAGLIDGALSSDFLQVVELERYQPDTIVLQGLVDEERLECVRRMKSFSQAFTVLELSDYLPELPIMGMRQRSADEVFDQLRRSLTHIDRVVVSTPALAEALAGLHPDVKILQSRLPNPEWQGLQAARRTGAKPRVGLVGKHLEQGDVELIAQIFKVMAGEVEWVFLGNCPDSLRPYIGALYPNADGEDYPVVLASLNLDLALIPKQMNRLNACTSNLRLLEHGACGVPVVATDVRCYQGFGDLHVTLVNNRPEDWVRAIRMHLDDLDATARVGDELREAVMRNWMLDGDHLSRWQKAWTAG